MRKVFVISFALLYIFFVGLVFADDDSITMAPNMHVADWDFSTGEHGWLSGDVSPIFPAPTFDYDGDNLVINTQNIGEYGWWWNDRLTFIDAITASDSLFRAQFYVSTNQTDLVRVPDIRLFIRNTSGQLNYAYGINSFNNGYASPESTPKIYDTYFEPHDGGLTEPYSELVFGIETANFNTVEPDSGEIYLSRVVIDRYDLTSLTFNITHDFQLSTWRFVSYPTFSAPIPTKTYNQLGLTSINNFDTYGLFKGEGDTASFKADTNGDPYIYKATFNVSTDVADPEQVPMFRMSLQTLSGREVGIAAIGSITGAHTAPDAVGKDYTVYFRPPLEEVTIAPITDRLMVPTFEMLNILYDDIDVGTVYLNSANVSYISESDLPVF